MSKRIKVRFHTWYWGNYCMALPSAKLLEGFELYDEEKHGWHNSEEFKRGKKKYDDGGSNDYYETIIGNSYIKRMTKRNAP